MASSSKRQTTMAKIQREQAMRERRARKQQKKDDKKLAGAADAAALDAPADVDADDTTAV
jgi:hypothetical protein